VDGLRERKKSQTRRVIAEAALRLFRARGFDTVTVDEVAQAAQVSKKTVFNYFPTKEDLLFPRADRREELLVEALAAVGPQLSLVESFRQLCLRQIRAVERLRHEVEQGEQSVFEMVHRHPALRRKLHENDARLTRRVAEGLAELSGRPVEDPVVVTVSETLLAAQQSLYRNLRARVAAGGSDEEIAADYRDDVHRLFDLLAHGLDAEDAFAPSPDAGTGEEGLRTLTAECRAYGRSSSVRRGC
jgi:AcrR family transcriptional regulator